MSERFLYLQAGLIVPIAAVDALLAIEAAGHKITLDGEDLLVEPRGHLDDHDLDQLRRWKQHCILLLRYTANDRHHRNDQHPRPDVGPIVVSTRLR